LTGPEQREEQSLEMDLNLMRGSRVAEGSLETVFRRFNRTHSTPPVSDGASPTAFQVCWTVVTFDSTAAGVARWRDGDSTALQS